MRWETEEITWIEANRGIIEGSDPSKIVEALANSSLDKYNRHRLVCGLAYVRGSDLVIRQIRRTYGESIVRVYAEFGKYADEIAELIVSQPDNLSLIVVRLSYYLKVRLKLSEDIIDYIIGKCWDTEIK